jgi:hypothetical protein
MADQHTDSDTFLTVLADALERQRQIDADGTEVGVSRQAVDEAIVFIRSCAKRIAQRSASTSEPPGTVAEILDWIESMTDDEPIRNMARAARRKLGTSEPAPQAAAMPAAPWMPIATAPLNGRKAIVGYRNSLGKWRTVMASYATEAMIEEAGEDSGHGETGASAGWYEECESAETLLPTDHPPTHWMPLPAPPVGADNASPRSDKPDSALADQSEAPN